MTEAIAIFFILASFVKFSIFGRQIIGVVVNKNITKVIVEKVTVNVRVVLVGDF